MAEENVQSVEEVEPTPVVEVTKPATKKVVKAATLLTPGQNVPPNKAPNVGNKAPK